MNKWVNSWKLAKEYMERPVVKLRVPVKSCECGEPFIPIPRSPDKCPTCFKLNEKATKDNS